MAIILTDHSEVRARQRLGLNRRALRRMAALAWSRGALIRHPVKEPSQVARRFGNGIWIFAMLDPDVVLLTVLWARRDLHGV